MFFQLKTVAILTAAVMTVGTAVASGGASGPAVNFAVQGNIGEVIVNLGWGAKFGSDDFELKGHLLSMVV